MRTAEEYATAVADELTEIEQHLQDGQFADPLYAVEEMNPLDWEYTATIGGDLKSIKMIHTVGGPSCYVVFAGNGEAEVITYWAGRRGRSFVLVPALEEIVWDTMEEMLCLRVQDGAA